MTGHHGQLAADINGLTARRFNNLADNFEVHRWCAQMQHAHQQMQLFQDIYKTRASEAKHS